MAYENEKTGIIEDQKTREIPAGTAGIDMIGGEPAAETAALPPELLNELGETKTIPIADTIEHGGRWDPYKGEIVPDESTPAPKRKRVAAIAAVAAAVLVVAIGVGVAVASPSADSGQQPTASSIAASSSSSSATKASKSSSSSAAAKADEAKEEPQEEQGAGDQQDQGASQDVGQAAAVSGGSGNSGGNSGGASEPQRHWVDEVGHNEQVLVQAAYDEPVYETVTYQYCKTCGCRVDDVNAHYATGSRTQQHAFTSKSETVQVDTIHHDAVYESQYVVDVPGHWE